MSLKIQKPRIGKLNSIYRKNFFSDLNNITVMKIVDKTEIAMKNIEKYIEFPPAVNPKMNSPRMNEIVHSIKNVKLNIPAVVLNN